MPKSNKRPKKTKSASNPSTQPADPKTTREEGERIIGVLTLHPRGFGFVKPDAPSDQRQDVFIPKHLTNDAIHKDLVEVLIDPHSNSNRGPEGKVLAIISRKQTHLVGVVDGVHQAGVSVHVPLLGHQQDVLLRPTKKHRLRAGDRVKLEVLEWGKKGLPTVGRFHSLLGHISDPQCDIPATIAEFELRSTFPPEAVREAAEFGSRVSQGAIREKGREDLRHLTVFTIDPSTAKDFDDALSLEKDLKKKTYLLGVHIADVSYYVQPGTAIDQEAYVRCNSTYFPNFCLPMLPHSLSDHLCSLKEGVNRLTVSVFMEFDSTGTLLSHRVCRSVIRSAKRFSYEEAKEVLDGRKKSNHAPTLALMMELCRLLKQKRYERGSIEFSLPELVVRVDEQGMPQGTDYITYDITHQMVEEFMLKANEIIALELHARGKNLTYRVHEEPAEENLRDFSVLANAFGFRVPSPPTPQDIQALFEEAGSTPYGSYLASCYIRKMRLAAYSIHNIGHYGLNLPHYCHFTSPIRRYVDLVAHRLLFGADDTAEYLEQISDQCSEQERISSKAEMRVLLTKKLRLLSAYHEEDSSREYRALITRVKGFGVYFEVIDLLLEGFIHISELGDEYFIFEERAMRLRGSASGVSLSAGREIVVSLRSLNLITQETSWRWIRSPSAAATSTRRVKSKRGNKPKSVVSAKKKERKKGESRE